MKHQTKRGREERSSQNEYKLAWPRLWLAWTASSLLLRRKQKRLLVA